MRISIFSIFIVIILFIIGCSRPPSDQNSSNNQLSGNIVNKGSDTIVNLALAWAEEYQRINPEVTISVTGGGSGTGIAALINGTVDIANASRQIKDEEKDTAIQNGMDPVEFVIAKDAIAIIVNLENPVDSLTIEQISDIYSGKITNWRELGGENRPIVKLSRETNSGTHVYFLENVLRMGDKKSKLLFSRDTLLLASSEGIGLEIKQNPNAIGYDGLGYVTEHLKVVAVARDSQSEYIMPSAETVTNGKYPIARDLYMYTNGQPRGLVKIYLDWILSPESQSIVNKLGFVTLFP